jgi:hypothetical protein
MGIKAYLRLFAFAQDMSDQLVAGAHARAATLDLFITRIH